jgi:hypothetical protein
MLLTSMGLPLTLQSIGGRRFPLTPFSTSCSIAGRTVGDSRVYTSFDQLLHYIHPDTKTWGQGVGFLRSGRVSGFYARGRRF